MQKLLRKQYKMSKISRSHERHTFQKQGYAKRMEEKGETPSESYLDYFQKILENEEHKFDDPKNRENNLEYDLLTTEWILEKVRSKDYYAQNLYAALCNTSWRSKNIWPTLKEQNWGCSWRYAGGIIADMRQEGDYINWYCSGISGGDEPDVYENGHDLQRKSYVREGFVTKEIEEDLDKLGWTLIEYDEKE
jgi:hypothetical protein